jgi:hypothetical protein
MLEPKVGFKDMAVSQINNFARFGVTTPQDRPQQQQQSRINVRRESRSLIETQDTVSLSTAERQREEGFSSAVRALGDLQSVVDAATIVTSRAEQALKSSLNIAKRLSQEVDPTKRQALASEGAELISQLDRIQSSATTPRGLSVTDQGPVNFSLSLDRDNPGSSVTVTLPNVSLSRDSLGLSGVSESTLLSSTTESREAIESAISAVSTVSASLSSASSAISQAAGRLGESSALRASRPNETEAQDLASQIAKSVTEADIVKQSNRLDPLKVTELLANEPEKEERSRPQEKNEKGAGLKLNTISQK